MCSIGYMVRDEISVEEKVQGMWSLVQHTKDYTIGHETPLNNFMKGSDTQSCPYLRKATQNVVRGSEISKRKIQRAHWF